MSSPPHSPRSEAVDPPIRLSMPAMPPRSVYDQLRATIEEESKRKPPKRLHRWASLALPAFAGALVVLDAVVRDRALLRSDALAVLGTCLPSALGALLLAVFLTLLAISPGPSGLGHRVALLRLGAFLVVPLSIFPMLLLAGAPRPAGLPVEHVDPWGVPCLLIGSAIAALSLALLIKILRQSVPVAVGWRSAALGSAAAAWSGLSLLLHCPALSLPHLLVGHLVPIALFPLVGFWLARRYLRI